MHEVRSERPAHGAFAMMAGELEGLSAFDAAAVMTDAAQRDQHCNAAAIRGDMHVERAELQLFNMTMIV